MISLDKEHADATYLAFLRQKIEVLLQWGGGENWRHSDFQALSEKILDSTGEQLSNTTLKRIWGKLEYRNLPNTHTLNTLAQFAGYENWLAFKTGYNLEDIPKTKNETQKWRVKSLIGSQPGVKILAIIGVLGLLILLSISLIPSTDTDVEKSLDAETLESITFSSHTVSVGVPNTVIFNYDVSKVDADSFHIQQSWDSRRRFPIKKDQFEIASTYYYPGHWRPKLVVDGQVVKEHDLYIKSDGWSSTIIRAPMPRYLQKDELFQGGYLSVSEAILQEIEARPEAPERLTFDYIDEFENLHSDNFSLEISFRNTYFKGDGICQFSRIGIDCTDGIFLVPFSIPGCVGDLSLQFSELKQKGNQQDFSAFGCDFQEWQHLRMMVKDKHAQLFLNQQLIHEASYQESAGKIAGLKIRFWGAGAIDNVKLSNEEGIVIFQDNFDGI